MQLPYIFYYRERHEKSKKYTERKIHVHVFMERGELPQKVTITGKVKVKGRKKPTVYTNNPLY